MRSFLLALALLVACDQRISREPIRLGVKDDAFGPVVAKAVAEHLQKKGCMVETTSGDSRTLDLKLRSGEIDAYVESHGVALTQILQKPPQPPQAAETEVRAAYLREDLMWAPVVGHGDLAVVFRRKADDRCRAASRAFMSTGGMLSSGR